MPHNDTRWVFVLYKLEALELNDSSGKRTNNLARESVKLCRGSLERVSSSPESADVKNNAWVFEPPRWND